MAPPKAKRRRDTQHLISTVPRAVACKCGALVLSCYVQGEPVRVDPVAINLSAEGTCLVIGSPTYQTGFGRNVTLFRRNAGMIAAGWPRYGRIHPRHRCGMDWDQPEYRDTREDESDGRERFHEAPF